MKEMHPCAMSLSGDFYVRTEPILSSTMYFPCLTIIFISCCLYKSGSKFNNLVFIMAFEKYTKP